MTPLPTDGRRHGPRFLDVGGEERDGAIPNVSEMRWLGNQREGSTAVVPTSDVALAHR